MIYIPPEMDVEIETHSKMQSLLFAVWWQAISPPSTWGHTFRVLLELKVLLLNLSTGILLMTEESGEGPQGFGGQSPSSLLQL